MGLGSWFLKGRKFEWSLLSTTSPRVGFEGTSTVTLSTVMGMASSMLGTIATSCVVGWLAGSDVTANPLLRWRPQVDMVRREKRSCCSRSC